MATFIELVDKYIFYETLAVIWILQLWVTYLNLRQRKLAKTLVEVPAVASSFMSKEVYDKARVYALDQSNFSIFNDFCGTCITTSFILSLIMILDTRNVAVSDMWLHLRSLQIYFLVFVLLHCWNWSLNIAEYIGIDPNNEILVSGICMFLTNLISSIVNFPLKVYKVFVLEEKHGFNKQSPLFFIKDRLLKFVVLQIICIPILCGMIWIIKNGGDYFFVYLWLFIVFTKLFMMMIYPEVIAPLFDKYTPLPEGDLKQKIEALAASLNYPLYKLFIVEGSKRSSHSNAYLYGFYKNKRIVLFDTLVKEYYKPDEKDQNKDKGCDTDEILAILSHELGHWKFNHTVKLLLLMQVGLIIMFASFSTLLYYAPMYEAFGFVETKPIFVGLVICCYVFTPVHTLEQFMLAVITRKFEFQADKFAVSLGHSDGLKRGLIKLHTDNLVFPMFDKLYSAWFHTHPSILERLEAIDKAQ